MINNQRIYIAGAYSSDNIIGCLNNIRYGMRAGVEVFLAGFAPWCPWHDFHHQLMLRDGEALTVQDYYRFSMAWLEVSDAVLVLEGWESSKGTKAEIEHAKKLNIPIFFSLKQLIDNYTDK